MVRQLFFVFVVFVQIFFGEDGKGKRGVMAVGLVPVKGVDPEAGISPFFLHPKKLPLLIKLG